MRERNCSGDICSFRRVDGKSITARERYNAELSLFALSN